LVFRVQKKSRPDQVQVFYDMNNGCFCIFVLCFYTRQFVHYFGKKMESLVYHINRSDLTASRWEEIRTAISQDLRAERVKIVVEPEDKEITNPELLQKIEENNQATFAYVIPREELSTIIAQSESDESFDAIGAISHFKRMTEQ
jgi:Mg/Co/Ni transporter MgtE